MLIVNVKATILHHIHTATSQVLSWLIKNHLLSSRQQWFTSASRLQLTRALVTLCVLRCRSKARSHKDRVRLRAAQPLACSMCVRRESIGYIDMRRAANIPCPTAVSEIGHSRVSLCQLGQFIGITEMLNRGHRHSWCFPADTFVFRDQM